MPILKMRQLSTAGWKLSSHKAVHTLILRAHEDVNLHGKRDSEGLTQLRILRWGGYPGLSLYAWCNHLVLIQRSQEDQSQRRRYKGRGKGQRREMPKALKMKGPWAKECTDFPGTLYNEMTSSYLSVLFFLSQWDWGFELRALCLQSRHSTTWGIPPVHFALIIFGDRVSWTISRGWPWTVISDLSLPSS
jgi:hypothetical protein